MADDPLQGAPSEVAWKNSKEEDKGRWVDMETILTRQSEKFVPPPFAPEEEDFLGWLQEDRRILVVGAGGLGCELLKNLALSGVKDIELIDLDTIELSNLNRQFLFREKDIGKPKAKCAAEFVMKRVPGVKIKWYQKKLQEFDESFYKKFDCVIAGLDNVEARRWLNSMLWQIVKTDEETGELDPDTIIPFVDGGTEGFSGQVRLFMPRITACFECSIGTMVKQKVVASCTIANIPRRPEHCIVFAHKVLWPRLRSFKDVNNYDMVPLEDKDTKDPCGVDLDKDDIQHMSWIFNRSLERAKEFNIEGVTYNLTMQVVKNIIPAIASTNALVSAACINECIKALTWCSYGLENYFQYIGQEGIACSTFQYERNKQCPVCGTEPLTYRLDPAKNTFEALYQKICNDETLKLKRPSVSCNGKVLYLTLKNFEEDYKKEYFSKPIGEVIEDGNVLEVTDPAVLGKDGVARIQVKFVEGEVYIPPKD